MDRAVSSGGADLVTWFRGVVRERGAIATTRRNGNPVGRVRLDGEGNESYVRGLQGLPTVTMTNKAKVRRRYTNKRLEETTIK